jgi:antitoxin component of RelBE/YafQ-DinJ toxin-antitoxin module
MPRPELSAAERRDKQVTTLLTKREKDAVARVAAEMGMSLSNAARYLINRGMADHPFTPLEGNDHE